MNKHIVVHACPNVEKLSQDYMKRHLGNIHQAVSDQPYARADLVAKKASTSTK